MNFSQSTFSTLPIKALLRSCPLCSSRKGYGLIDLEFVLFDDSPLVGTMQLTACGKCGFVFYDTKSTKADFNDFYQNHYFIHAYYSTSNDYQFDGQCYSQTASLFKEHGLSSSSRLYDVGCGQGQLIRLLRISGFTNIAGVEICADYVNELNSEGIEAHLGSAYKLPIKEGEADLLIYKHIFEHFYEVHSAVKEACNSLAPGGLLFVAVPDTSCYNKFKDYSFLHYLTLEHINHFDLPHLEVLFGMYGMVLENSETRMLDIKEDFPVPIMSCLFRKRSDPVPLSPRGDFSLARNVMDWYVESKNLSTYALEELEKSQRDVYVWGLSYRTAMYLAMSPLKRCNIKKYLDIDTRKQKKTIMGKPVESPELLKDLNGDATVVIGVGPSSNSMKNHLRSLGFTGEIILLN